MGSGPIDETVDVAALGLMTVRLGMDATWPAALTTRVEAMSDKVAIFNKIRFGDSPAGA